MTAIAIVILFLAAFGSSFIQRVTGFGFGILFVSVTPFVMASHGQATTLSGLLAMVCSLYTAIKLFRHTNWKKIALILLTFIIVSYFAVGAVHQMNAALMRDFLGVTLIIVSLYFLFMNGRIHLKPTPFVQLSMGTISGITGGFFGMQGPPAVLYLISCSKTKEEYMANCQWYFIIGNIFMTAYRSANGFLDSSVFKLFAICVPAVLLGIFFGSKVYKLIEVDLLKKIVYIFIGIAGVVSIIL